MKNSVQFRVFFKRLLFQCKRITKSVSVILNEGDFFAPSLNTCLRFVGHQSTTALTSLFHQNKFSSILVIPRDILSSRLFLSVNQIKSFLSVNQLKLSYKMFSKSLARSYNSFFKQKTVQNILTKNSSQLSFEDVKSKQIAIYDKELQRQTEAVGRVERIKVQYRGTPEDVLLMMNKHLSTPYHCAQHMSEMLTKRSALALVNGTEHWDLHRPLESDCEIQLLHFQDPDPFQVNKAYWRMCCVVLGAVVSNAFKDNLQVNLHSFPSPNVRSGSFVYDVEIPELQDWKPSADELRILSAEMVILSRKELPLLRLSVGEEVAKELFSHNKFKLDQIPSIVEQSPDKKVIVYRVGDHLDISRGPMVANTSFIGRCTIASVHQIENDNCSLYRFQGVSLPRGIFLNHFAYSVLEDRARRLNSSLYAGEISTETFKPNFKEKAVN